VLDFPELSITVGAEPTEHYISSYGKTFRLCKELTLTDKNHGEAHMICRLPTVVIQGKLGIVYEGLASERPESFETARQDDGSIVVSYDEGEVDLYLVVAEGSFDCSINKEPFPITGYKVRLSVENFTEITLWYANNEGVPYALQGFLVEAEGLKSMPTECRRSTRFRTNRLQTACYT